MSVVALFIDFEYFVYGATSKDMEPPAPAELMIKAATYGSVRSAKAFGTSAVLDRFTQELRASSIEPILCTSTGTTNRKNVTDFFMLNSIYQTAYAQSPIDTYVIVTGDNDFASAVGYLRYRLEKFTVVLAYPDSVGEGLKKAANDFIGLTPVEVRDWPIEEKLRLIRFVNTGEKQGKVITLASTARVYKSGGSSEEERRRQIMRMLEDGVFYQREEDMGGQLVRRLYLNRNHPLVREALQTDV